MKLKNVRFLGRRGFTLIELMATVAIIGVLAAIAIPNYVKYQRKARQAEVKVTLASLFTAESAARGAPETGNSYHMCLNNLGGGTLGNNYYATGFSAGFAVPNLCGQGSNQACTWFSYAGVAPMTSCTHAAGQTGFNAVVFVDPAVAATTTANIDAALTSNSVTRTTFVVGSSGWIGGTVPDQWSVDQNKAIYQTHDGIN